MNLNITIPVVAGLAILFWILKEGVLPWIISKIGTEKTKKLLNIVELIQEKAKELVLWAKNNYPDNSGVQKMAAVKERIMKWLETIGVEVDEETIEGYIQEAYNNLKKSLEEGTEDTEGTETN